MKTSLFKNPVLWISSAFVGGGIVLACSSTTTPPGGTTATCSGNDQVACTCEDGGSGTATCGNPASCSCNGTPQTEDSGSQDLDSGHNGDGGHVDEGGSPAELYGACARAGSFGSPCTGTTPTVATLDPTECTDPNFPYCFGGNQGYWCTAACDDDAGAPQLAICTAAAVASETADAGTPDAGDGGDGGSIDAGGAGCTPSACNNRGYCK